MRVVVDLNRCQGYAQCVFLAPDVFARRTQIVHVVEVDGSEHGDVRIDRVNRVQPPTQPDFKDQDVRCDARKEPQRRQHAAAGEQPTPPGANRR